MMAETSAASGSIPTGRVGVKKALLGLLVGLPVSVAEYSARAEVGMNAEEFLLAFSRLFTVERQVIVSGRFQVGDLWNALHTLPFRAARVRLLAAIDAKMTVEGAKRYKKRLRQCGWVAHKWPVGSRSDKHGWTYYVENAEGDVARGAGCEETPYFFGVCRVLRDDGEWIEGEGNSGRAAIMRCVGELPVRDERTK